MRAHASERLHGISVDHDGREAGRVLSTLASIAGVFNTPPKAMMFVPTTMQTCPRRRASLATNARRGGQGVFGAGSSQVTVMREAVIAAFLTQIVCFTKRWFLERNAVRTVHDAVQDCIGDGGIVQPRMPLVDRQLAGGDQRRLRAHPVVEQFEQIASLAAVHRGAREVVQKQHVHAGELRQASGEAAFAVGHAQFLHEARGARVQHAEAATRGLPRQSARASAHACGGVRRRDEQYYF
jgi:hypothetical protein